MKCMKENQLAGIQRFGHQREKYHVKDLLCIDCKCTTKNMEVRWCDAYEEIYERAMKECKKYYPKTENNVNRKVV